MIKWIQESFNFQAFLLASTFCILTVVYLSLMGGCIPFKSPPRENFEIKMEPSTGYCKDWSLIEMEMHGHTSCSERRILNGHSVVCTRRLGHYGSHHMHGAKDCFWMW